MYKMPENVVGRTIKLNSLYRLNQNDDPNNSEFDLSDNTITGLDADITLEFFHAPQLQHNITIHNNKFRWIEYLEDVDPKNLSIEFDPKNISKASFVESLQTKMNGESTAEGHDITYAITIDDKNGKITFTGTGTDKTFELHFTDSNNMSKLLGFKNGEITSRSLESVSSRTPNFDIPRIIDIRLDGYTYGFEAENYHKRNLLVSFVSPDDDIIYKEFDGIEKSYSIKNLFAVKRFNITTDYGNGTVLAPIEDWELSFFIRKYRSKTPKLPDKPHIDVLHLTPSY